MGMRWACLQGRTGQLCNVPFETCSGSHKCYHGGQCIPGAYDAYGNEQLRCDCYSAMDPATGDPYVGDFCEHRASNFATTTRRASPTAATRRTFASSAEFAIPSSPLEAARPVGVHPAAPASTASTPEVTDNNTATVAGTVRVPGIRIAAAAGTTADTRLLAARCGANNAPSTNAECDGRA